MEKGACVPQRVHTVVVSVQHSEEITLEQLRKEIMEKVVRVVIPEKYLDEQTVYHIQPSGRFVIGGPQVRRMAQRSVSNFKVQALFYRELMDHKLSMRTCRFLPACH